MIETDQEQNWVLLGARREALSDAKHAMPSSAGPQHIRQVLCLTQGSRSAYFTCDFEPLTSAYLRADHMASHAGPSHFCNDDDVL